MFHRTPVLLAVLVGLFIAAIAAHAQDIRKSSDIVSQVQYLKVRGDPMGFRVPVNSVILSGLHHWQGIARHPDPSRPYFYAVSSRAGCTELHVIRMGSSDSKSGYRMRSNRLDPTTIAISTSPPATDRVVNTVPLGDTHGGGMQAAGNYLAIPMGDHDGCVPSSDTYESQPRIAIYDISDPENPVLARMLHDQDDTGYYPGPPAFNSIPGGISVLGFAQRDDGSFFLFGNYGSELWHWSLSADLTTFSRRGIYTDLPASDWPEGRDTADYSFQSFQIINPLGEVASGGTEILYMLGLQNYTGAGIGADYVWLYRLTLNSSGRITGMQKISQTQISSRTSADSPQMNGNFAAAGAAWVSPTGGLLLYSCDHYISGLSYSVVMSEFSDRSGDSPATVPADGCTAQVFLYTDPDYDGKVLTIDALDFGYKNYDNLLIGHEGAGGFSNNVSSVTWRIPPGCVARLYNGTGQAGNYLELSGAGGLSNLANVSWTSGNGECNNAFSSVAFVGNATPATILYLPPVPTSVLNNFIFPSPCATLKLSEGAYPGPGFIDRRVEIRSTGGLVRLGGQ